MDLYTAVCERLGCRFPVLQAGMGGVARSELVAAVAETGGYGFLGMVREPPALVAAEIDAVRAATERRFGVNLIPAATERALLDAQIELCLERGVHSLRFFWEVDEAATRRARDGGAVVLWQVGSAEDARRAEDAGAELVIAQGVEAGGHVRGRLGSLALLPQVVAAVSVPVVASGGFASGASLVAALALGAAGVHCGTAFLATRESYAHPHHKQRVVAAGEEDTVHTDAFAINWPPGSPVRVLSSALTEALDGRLTGHHPDRMSREVVGFDGKRPLYRYSTDSPLRDTVGDPEGLALFAGQVAGSIGDLPCAGERVARIVDEARCVLDRLTALRGQAAA